MASFASSATTGGARKHTWTKIIPDTFKATYMIDDLVGLYHQGGQGVARAADARQTCQFGNFYLEVKQNCKHPQ